MVKLTKGKSGWEAVRLGLVPIGKFVFSHAEALRQKIIIESCLKKWGINFVSLDSILPDGLVRDQKHVKPVVEFLSRKNLDAVFLPHCNFGTEHAAGQIAQQLGLPVLLWGARDQAPLPDGTRARDTLCGLFATSKVLHRLGVKFTYIQNCHIEEPSFKQGLFRFLSAAWVNRKFRSLRIGFLGTRIDFFWTTIINEGELLEKFGIEILPLDMVCFLDAVLKQARTKRSLYLKEIKLLKQRFDLSCFTDQEPLLNLLSLRDHLLGLSEKENLSCFAIQSFLSLAEKLGAGMELAAAMVSDEGIPIACESDIHGAISAVILQAASLEKEPIFLADLTVRHPRDNQAVLLWHTFTPLSMIDPEVKPKISDFWILKNLPRGSCYWRMKPGRLTVLRFDGDRGNYSLICGQGKTIDGPYTCDAYGWMKVKNWSCWEKSFIEGPYIHHVAVNYGWHRDVVAEAIKYLPGNISFQQLD